MRYAYRMQIKRQKLGVEAWERGYPDPASTTAKGLVPRLGKGLDLLLFSGGEGWVALSMHPEEYCLSYPPCAQKFCIEFLSALKEERAILLTSTP